MVHIVRHIPSVDMDNVQNNTYSPSNSHKPSDKIFTLLYILVVEKLIRAFLSSTIVGNKLTEILNTGSFKNSKDFIFFETFLKSL